MSLYRLEENLLAGGCCSGAYTGAQALHCPSLHPPHPPKVSVSSWPSLQGICVTPTGSCDAECCPHCSGFSAQEELNRVGPTLKAPPILDPGTDGSVRKKALQPGPQTRVGLTPGGRPAARRAQGVCWQGRGRPPDAGDIAPSAFQDACVTGILGMCFHQIWKLLFEDHVKEGLRSCPS